MSHPSAPAALRLTYAFERVYCTHIHAGEAEHRPYFGKATIAYDGRGRWWIEALVTHNRFIDRPDIHLTPGADLWRQIAVALETTHREAINDAINVAMVNGGHMALFDEHLPNEDVRRGPPPHVSFRLRRAARRAAGHVAAMVGLVLLCGSILAGGSIATMPWPGPQGTAQAGRLVVAEAAR